MSTRATIKFKDEYEEYYIYRHCDGFPEIVLEDINRVIEITANNWADGGCGMLVSFFLGMTFKEKSRIQKYELTTGFHGDESYKYFVEYSNGKWKSRL